MKTLELIEKAFKKCSTQQLFAKLAKLNQNSQEYGIIISLLEGRGQNVSNWKNEEQDAPVSETAQESTTPTLDELKERVDQFVDELIVAKRTGVYTEVMKTLGGDYESDLDDLFEVATMEQLQAALEFKNIPEQVKEETVPKVKKEKVQKEKSTTAKESPKEGSKSADIFEYLKTHPNEKLNAVAKHFNTYYSVVERVKKIYLK